MSKRVLPVLLAGVALVLFVGFAAAQEEKKADKADYHEGTVVSAAGGKLVMKDKDGKEHTHDKVGTVTVTVDGKNAKLEDLKPGQKIRVYTKQGDPKTVEKIMALDKEKDFPKDK